jgi:hypothetical protein
MFPSIRVSTGWMISIGPPIMRETLGSLGVISVVSREVV